MTGLMKFTDFFNNVDSFELENALYVQSREWKPDSMVAVLDPDEAENPEGEDFAFKEENSLFYALQISTVREVIEYCSSDSHKASMTKCEMLAALAFYFQHDSFPEIN